MGPGRCRWIAPGEPVALLGDSGAPASRAMHAGLRRPAAPRRRLRPAAPARGKSRPVGSLCRQAHSPRVTERLVRIRRPVTRSPGTHRARAASDRPVPGRQQGIQQHAAIATATALSSSRASSSRTRRRSRESISRGCPTPPLRAGRERRQELADLRRDASHRPEPCQRSVGWGIWDETVDVPASDGPRTPDRAQ